ncbi:MAG: site-2 protease family protein [Verrucomicrobiota bacterium]|nr:site-2 protease family protein [Verrucomicrobiota bacterium]
MVWQEKLHVLFDIDTSFVVYMVSVETLFAMFCALLGLGLLVFLHELGHYWVARREGMRVEAFSIGFGKPIYTWTRDGVKWMICMLPFGGYVRIAGMQKEGEKEPHEIPDGFYAKKPMQRIRVALAGPLVNILFALFLFCILWGTGGREKSFAEFTHRIGWVDPSSNLYQMGVRSGDLIERYGDSSFHGAKDLLITSLLQKGDIRIEGEKIDPETGKNTPFDYKLTPYPHPQLAQAKLRTVGVLAPASYLYFTSSPDSFPTVAASGIEPGDRLLWADGERIYSLQQLSSLVNRSTALLTVERDGAFIQTKVDRIRLEDLRLTSYERAEVEDWQYEAGIKGRWQDLYFIPYSLSPTGVVERRVDFLEPQSEKKKENFALQEGDRIVAIDGIAAPTAYQLLEMLQTRRVLTIVDRSPHKVLSLKESEVQFDQFSHVALQQLVAGIGRPGAPLAEGDLYRLRPITPQWKGDRFVLGLGLQDRTVLYNPNPLELFQGAARETWQTLSALTAGTLHPKYMTGPVGIVQVMQQSWMVGAKEALFWLALISFNLGIVNLLPIPVLDGGHILLSLLEAIRRKPFRAQTLERLVMPFVGLLILFFLYVTYQDITRLFSALFGR